MRVPRIVRPTIKRITNYGIAGNRNGKSGIAAIGLSQRGCSKKNEDNGKNEAVINFHTIDFKMGVNR